MTSQNSIAPQNFDEQSKKINDFLADLKEQVLVSQAMHTLGVDTELTSALKQVFENPLDMLIAFKSSADDAIRQIIVISIKTILLSKKDLINKAFLTDTGNSDLHFSIVLKEDTSENRDEIFRLFSIYEDSKLYEIFPIYFQFVPSRVADMVPVKQYLLS